MHNNEWITVNKQEAHRLLLIPSRQCKVPGWQLPLRHWYMVLLRTYNRRIWSGQGYQWRLPWAGDKGCTGCSLGKKVEITFWAGSTNYGLWAKPNPSDVFINKIIGSQPHPLAYILSIAAFALQWQIQVVGTETTWFVKYKVFTVWSFIENIYQPLF